MMNIKMTNGIFKALVLITVLMCTALTAHADEKDELKARFAQRDGQLTALKAQGKIGETARGFVEAVKVDPPLDAAAKQVMDEENADRRKLYDIIARENRQTAADVGIHNGLRNFASAKSNEYLKASQGPWVRRSDVAALKREGKIGETWQGYLEAVDNADRNDARISAVMLVENSARKYLYQKRALDKKNTTAEQEAQQAGRENLQNARSGEYVKEKDGAWKKK